MWGETVLKRHILQIVYKVMIHSFLAMTLSAEAYVDNVSTTYVKTRKHPFKEEWDRAMKSEIESFHKNKTWTLVEKPQNRNKVDAK